MGRLPILTRLALGRSAFEPHTPAPPTDDPTDPELFVGQAYDPSGRPVNAASDALARALAQAKNEVLETIGVTERKVRARRRGAADADGARGGQRLPGPGLAKEDEVGGDVAVVAAFVRVVLLRFVDGVAFRLQAGLIDPSLPFGEMLLAELRALGKGGFGGFIGASTAGMGTLMLSGVLFDYASDGLHYGVSLVHRSIFASGLTRKRKRACQTALLHAHDAGQRVILLSVTPLSVIAMLQHMRLIESGYGGCFLSALVPWARTSPLSWAWSLGPASNSFLRKLSNLFFSPVSLFLMIKTVSGWIRANGHLFKTRDGRPAILTPNRTSRRNIAEAAAAANEASILLWPLLKLRDRVLDMTGWAHSSYFPPHVQPRLRRARTLRDNSPLPDNGISIDATVSVSGTEVSEDSTFSVSGTDISRLDAAEIEAALVRAERYAGVIGVSPGHHSPATQPGSPSSTSSSPSLAELDASQELGEHVSEDQISSSADSTSSMSGPALHAYGRHSSYPAASSLARSSSSVRFHSTSLSTRPATWLGDRLNDLVWNVVRAPLDTLLCRSLLSAWVWSPLYNPHALTFPPSASLAPVLLGRLASPGGGVMPGVVDAGLLASFRAEQAGNLASKLGLCLGLQSVVDAGIWASIWWVARSTALARAVAA